MFTVEGLADIELHRNPFEFDELLEFQKPFLKMSGWKADAVVGLYHPERKIRACPVAVLPTALYKSTTGGNEKVELSFWKYGHWQKTIVDREVISSRTKIVTLANAGIEVNSKNAGALMEALSEIISFSLDSMHTYAYCSHLGWHRGEFIPYSAFVKFDSDGDYKNIYDSIDHKGGIEDWVRHMAPLMSNHRFRLVMAASFASPLIEIVGQNPFILHIWGKTGTGKTVAAMCAASVWGDPNQGRYLKSLNMTVNALLTTASVLKNLPFIGDELQTIKNHTDGYDNLIMTAGEGINRGRMNRSKMEETLFWKNSFIFTGEEPLIHTGSGAGAVNRVIQIEADKDLIPDGNGTANFVRSRYGEAGKQFVDALDRKTVREYYDNYRYALIEELKIAGRRTTDKQVNSMALLLTADAMASAQFFKDSYKPLRPEEILPYLTDPKEVDIGERAFDYICNVISANSHNFTTEAKEAWGKPGPDNTLYFNNTILERELNKGGFKLSAVKSPWADSGRIIMSSKDGRYRHVINVWGSTASCTQLVMPKSGED